MAVSSPMGTAMTIAMPRMMNVPSSPHSQRAWARKGAQALHGGTNAPPGWILRPASRSGSPRQRAAQ